MSVCVYIYIRICQYHSHFIHSSVDRHLHCIHVLATVNRATVNIGVYESFQIVFLLFPDICPGAGLLDHSVALILVF